MSKVTNSQTIENQAVTPEVFDNANGIPDVVTIPATTVLPSDAILDLDLSHKFDVLVAYQKFHNFTLRDGEVKTKEKDNAGEIETLYNVVIIGTTIEEVGITKNNTRFFTTGEVFLSPKDGFYSCVGSIVNGDLSTEFDTRKLISPKVRQFLAAQVQAMLERKEASTKLRDERNLKASNHLKSLIKPRAVK